MKRIIVLLILIVSKTICAQQIVYESMLIKNNGVYKLNNVAYSGEVIYLNSKGQITSRYPVLEGKPKGVYTAYFEEPDFKKNKFQDSSLVRFLKDSINITEKGLETLLEDSLICHNNLSDYILNEMGGEKKLLKLQEKYEDNKLKRKALEKWNVYNVLLNSLIFKGREIISCQDRLNNIKSNLNNEIQKPLYQPVIKEKFDQREFIKSGFYNEYYKSEKIKVVGEYINNLQNGNWTYYFQNGAIAAEGSFNLGKGEDKQFLSTDLQIPQNGREGKWLFYYDHGILAEEVNYKSGVWDGLRIQYYFNGKPKELSNFTNGKLNGSLIAYLTNERKTRECFYKDGKLDGLEQVFNSEGIKVSETLYTNGLKNGKEKIYYESGKIKEDNTYVNGKQSGYQIEFFENGKKKIEGICQNNKPHGWVKTYYESGKLQTVGTTDSLSQVAGHLIGDFTSYNEDGSIKIKGYAHRDGRLEDKTPVNINYAEVNKPYKCKCCKKTINGIFDAYNAYDYGENSTIETIRSVAKDQNYTKEFLAFMHYNTRYDFLRGWFPFCTMKCEKACG